VKPEHEEDHRQDAIDQYDKFVMSGSPLRESLGYSQNNLGHGNECSECNNAIVFDMQKTRDDHFKDGLSE
jgi:hypothetical protein